MSIGLSVYFTYLTEYNRVKSVEASGTHREVSGRLRSALHPRMAKPEHGAVDPDRDRNAAVWEATNSVSPNVYSMRSHNNREIVSGQPLRPFKSQIFGQMKG